MKPVREAENNEYHMYMYIMASPWHLVIGTNKFYFGIIGHRDSSTGHNWPGENVADRATYIAAPGRRQTLKYGVSARALPQSALRLIMAF